MSKQPVTVQLKEPIQHGTEAITSLTLHPLKARDLRGMSLDNPGMGDFMDILSNSARQPPSVIEELDVEDLMECIGVVKDFFPSSLPTGKSR